MARIVSIGAALQDVYLIDHDDFGTNKRGFFNQLELGAKVDIDEVKFTVGGGNLRWLRSEISSSAWSISSGSCL